MSNKEKWSKSLRNLLKTVFGKYREQIMYLFFGVLATMLSIGSFVFCVDGLKMGALSANVVSWVAAVTFAFFTNRKVVFQSSERNVAKEFVAFISGRLLTLALEEALFVLLLMVWNNVKVIKLIGQAVVIISNYFISKFIVFRQR